MRWDTISCFEVLVGNAVILWMLRRLIFSPKAHLILAWILPMPLFSINSALVICCIPCSVCSRDRVCADRQAKAEQQKSNYYNRLTTCAYPCACAACRYCTADINEACTWHV